MNDTTSKILVNDEFAEYFSVSELYPSCVDVLDVLPPPYSILRHFRQHPLHADYVMKITFSRSVLLAQLKVSYFSLTVSAVTPMFLYPYYLRYSHGSERSIWVYFRIPNEMKHVQ